MIEDKEKKIKETPDLTFKKKKYKMDLIPPSLIIARHFAAEQSAIEALEVKQEAAARELDEFIEENSGEEGLIDDPRNDKGSVTKAAAQEIKNQLTSIEGQPDGAEERASLHRCLELVAAETAATKAVKDARAALDVKVLAQYAKLTEAEIKTLVVDDKWFAAIWSALEGELQRLTQALATRVKELEERYTAALPVLVDQIDELSEKVEAHLKAMGVSC